MKQKILIIDDEPDLRKIYSIYLEAEDCSIYEAGTGMEGRHLIAEQDPDLLLLDLNLPDDSGLEILKFIKQNFPGIETIIISGTGDIDKALESIKLGAFDYIEKPVNSNRLIITARNALSHANLHRENASLLADTKQQFDIVGNSKVMERVFELINIGGPSDASVLITGESGVGKELVARGIQSRSARRKKPFIQLNCAAIPQELIESELFGHMKGSFTGATSDKAGKAELADGGTLFLDEIGDMSLMTQAKVLRFLQNGEIEPVGGTGSKNVNVRIIAATNKDLLNEIKENRFREDLYYRLNVISIKIPALKDRMEDIPSLVNYFLNKHGLEKGYKVESIGKRALKQLERYDWPGNVRELENVIERSIIFCTGKKIKDIDHPAMGPGTIPIMDEPDGGSFDNQVNYFSKTVIKKALDKYDWNQSRTADQLGLHRNTLQSKIKKLNITKE